MFQYLLNFNMLAERRRTLNSKFICSLITNKINSPPSLLSQTKFKVSSYTSRFHKTFYIPSATTNYLQNEPIKRIMLLAHEDPSFDVLF